MNLFTRYLVVFSVTIGLSANGHTQNLKIEPAHESEDQNQKSALSNALISGFAVAGISALGSGVLMLLLGVSSEPKNSDESKNESVNDLSRGAKFLKAFAATLVAREVGRHRYHEAQRKIGEMAIAKADPQLKSYLQLSPEKQHEYLTNESLPLVDIIPALAMPDRFNDFLASEGFKLLSDREAKDLLLRTDSEQQTVFYLLPYSREVMNKDFFKNLDSTTQLEIIYTASPAEFYIKKTTFMGVDIARTVTAAVYGLNLRALELIGYYYDPIFLFFLEKGLPPDAIGEILSYQTTETFEYFQISPRSLFMIANLGVAYKKADHVILKTYGDGVRGVLSGATEMVVYPITDTLKAVVPLLWQEAE